MTNHLTADVVLTFAYPVPDEYEPRPLEFVQNPQSELEDRDQHFLSVRNYNGWMPIAREQGQWYVTVPWMEVAAMYARANGWTDDCPTFGRGEGGPGLQLPSGLWLLACDVDNDQLFGEV